MSLISLLEQTEELASGSRIGMFSYGSGAVGEFFVGKVQEGYQDHVLKDTHEQLLADRTKLSIEEYEKVLSTPVEVDSDGDVSVLTENTKAEDIVFAGVDGHRRQYQKANN